MSPADFRACVMSYCFAMGASETSGLRTTAHNAAVGGVAGSAHRFGLAVDVVYDRTPDEASAKLWAQRLGLRLIRETDHDHLQPWEWPAG